MPTVLLADESPAVQRVIALTLAGEGIEVTTVSDGDEALARIQRDRPDVVLAGTSTPRRTGYDLASFVRSTPELAHVAVVLLAGAFEAVDEQRATDAGCAGVLVKPFEPQQLVQRIRECLAARRASAHAGTAGGAGGTAPARNAALDEYFDRLDAAFARRAASGPASVAADPDQPFDAVASDFFIPEHALTLPAPAVRQPDTPVGEARGVDSAGAGLPDDAAGEAPVPTLDQLLPAAAPASRSKDAVPAVDDALIDEVTRRVVARLGEAAVERVVADVVADVAERLIREEIARIRGKR